MADNTQTGSWLDDLLNSNAAIYQNNSQQQNTQKPAKGGKQNSQQQSQQTSSMPADDPAKHLNSVILAAVAPMVAQHAVQAYQQTGQIPNAQDVLQQHANPFSNQNSVNSMAAMNTMMQGQNQNNANGIAALQSLMQAKGQNQQSSPQVLPPSNPLTSPGYDPNTGNVQEGGFINRAVRGLAGGGVLGALAGLAGPNATQKMEAIGAAQKLKAGQPAEIAEPASRAALNKSLQKQTEQQIAGLTPEQQANFQKEMAQGKRETENQYMQRLDDTIKAHQEYQDTLVKNTNFFGRGEKMKQNEAIINTLQKIRAKRIASNLSGAESPSYKIPAIGAVENGYRFKGGNPSKQENWEKT